jgi:hypothetical protein
MNFSKTVEDIKTLIQDILRLEREYEEAVNISQNKSREAFQFLQESLKPVTSTYIKYYPKIDSIKNKITVNQNDKEWTFTWNQEHGLQLLKNPEANESNDKNGNYPIEELASEIYRRLQGTLNNISNKKAKEDERIQQLDKAIVSLKDFQSHQKQN